LQRRGVRAPNQHLRLERQRPLLGLPRRRNSSSWCSSRKCSSRRHLKGAYASSSASASWRWHRRRDVGQRGKRR
jgi:hypothetical protein